MRKKITCLALVSLLALNFMACNSQGEDPPEQPTIEGINILDLLAINLIGGVYWEGGTTVQTCVFDPGNVVNNSVSCDILEDVHANLIATDPNNMRLQLSLVDNQITGTMSLTVPHLNLFGSNFTVGLTGSSVSSSNAAEVPQNSEDVARTITFTPISVTPSTADLTLSVGSFVTEESENALSGRLTTTIGQTGNTQSATVTYGFSLRKGL